MLAIARRLVALILVLPPVLAVASSSDLDAAETRAVAFLEKVYAGKQLKDKDWLTKQMRNSAPLQGFGGLGALVKSSQQMAEKHGGLKGIKIIERQDLGRGVFQIRAEVEFKKSLQIDTGSTAIAREDLIWTIRVRREQDRLKLEF